MISNRGFSASFPIESTKSVFHLFLSGIFVSMVNMHAVYILRYNRIIIIHAGST